MFERQVFDVYTFNDHYETMLIEGERDRESKRTASKPGNLLPVGRDISFCWS